MKIEDIMERIIDEYFQEAIYIASPTLYYKLNDWLNGTLKSEKEKKKLIYSLAKYANRISSRCTPYGLFASCSTGEWNDRNEIILSNKLIRHTRFDMDFACSLSRHLWRYDFIKSRALFYTNNSLYSQGDELRYVMYDYKKANRAYTIKSVEKNKYLLKILEMAKNGALLTVLKQSLIEYEISETESEVFLEELIDNQLLFCELEPIVSGDDFLSRTIEILNRINPDKVDEKINQLIHHLSNLDALMKKMDLKVGNENENYKNLIDSIKQLNISIKEDRLLQVDLFRQTKEATLSFRIQEDLLNAIKFLNKFSHGYQNSTLINFQNKFVELYEEREKSLLEVLDSETGIGYPTKDISGVNPIVDDLPIIRKGGVNSKIDWNAKEEFLLLKLITANKLESYSISFTDEEILYSSNEEQHLCVTFPIMFRIIDASKNKLCLTLVGGNASAANLLGRFAYGNKEIHNIIKDIISYENKIDNEKLIAEIVHLPEDRTGNILFRPVFREYEIPYLSNSNLPQEFQIPLEDILVSIKNKRILLRSKRLNKEIVPRLSTAHNYSQLNSLPVYRFLCDLQFQDIDKPLLGFNWGTLSKSFKFLPRAEYKNIVISPAAWNLTYRDFADIIKYIDTSDFISKVDEFRTKWRMPRYVLLKDNDNELLVDLESDLSAKVMLDAIKKRSNIEINEFLFDPETSIVSDTNNNPFTNEIIAVIFNKKKSTVRPQDLVCFNNSDKGDVNVKRTFIPGSEWVYYKLYCGVRSADKLLCTFIKDLVDTLKRRGLLEKWFFVRYMDPDFHIRLRFYNTDINKISEISKITYSYLNKLQEEGVIYKILNDTYIREIERYGSEIIEYTEEYFSIDSSMILSLLSCIENDPTQEIRLKFAFKCIDDTLDSFCYNIDQKLHLMEALKNAYMNEHGGDKSLKIELDKKYRGMKSNLLNGIKKDTEISRILSGRNFELQPIVFKILELQKKIQVDNNLDKILSSYIHMTINRLFIGKQRTYELVIYDLFYRHYKSQIARSEINLKLIL